MKDNILPLLKTVDLTEIFKETGNGNVKKWSSKRTFSGAVVALAMVDVQTNGLSWMSVALIAIAALPLSLSVWQKPLGE